MDHGKKKSPRSPVASKKERPLGVVIALAAAGGVVVGSAGTYYFTKPLAAPKPSTLPAAGGTLPARSTSMPQPQFTSAPQPPGKVPPGKVWSFEHGHWHDAPVTLTTPTLPLATPGTTTVPAPAPVTPATAPPEKNE